ncbi:methyltransferase [Acidihalobacter yilgarnensis]|uniref:Methyltransferase n=1 Tax=Acidihalobacter yilgarnensis TaxID=2819280 RepID=A0A1D8IK07_9GAMM|nr:methyltransferase [Acidihalobacter yilgarnensis]AOU96807.1 methyltransferase [Acidihalobacter yilgarnensis]
MDSSNPPDPSHILHTANAFWASKTLLTAVEFDLFSCLGDAAMSGEALAEVLGLHPRGRDDFLDALVALGFLARDGDGAAGRYRNTPDTAAFLDRRSPRYLGGLLGMLNARTFGFWNDLGAALRTGQPQSEIKSSGRSYFEDLHGDAPRLAQFLEAMSGVQMENFHRLAERFDFTPYARMSDLGGALALLSRVLAGRYPHLSCTSFDLPAVAPHARRAVEAAGLGDRIRIASGDFFTDPLPVAEVITMGNVLHDWDLARKQALIGRVYEALPPGGVFIVIENLIDDARRENVFGLLMSLNMLLELGDAFDYTGADLRGWCEAAGFRAFEVVPLTEAASAGIAYK